MNDTPRVVEAGLRNFQCAYERYIEQPFSLGQFITVREGPWPIFAVVAEVANGPEDPSRPLQAMGGDMSAAEVFAAEPHLRPLLRTRVTAVSCGYFEGEAPRAALPPIPPPLLGRVEAAQDAEVRRIAAGAGFLALLLTSPLCDDAVIAASLRAAAGACAPASRTFMVEAGKELARLLKAEPSRLTSILRGVA